MFRGLGGAGLWAEGGADPEAKRGASHETGERGIADPGAGVMLVSALRLVRLPGLV